MQTDADRSPTPVRVRAGERVQHLSASVCAADLLELLDGIRASGVTFDLARYAGRFELQWSKSLTPEGIERLEPWLPWLEHVAVGRYTGHAPAVCSVCGELAMVPIVSTGGTRMGRKSTGWARCRMSNTWGEPRRRGRGTIETIVGCPGRMVIREVDFEGVKRVKPPGIPTLKRWKEQHP